MCDFKIKKTNLIVANLMDSSLLDLEKKGVFETIGNIYNPYCAYKKVIHFSPHVDDEALQKKLGNYNIEIKTHHAAGLRPIKIILAIYLVYKTIKIESVDIVRGRLPYLSSLIGLIAAKLTKKKFVVSLGGDNRIPQELNKQYHYNSRFFSYLIEWFVLSLSNSVICPNEFTKRYVSKIIGEKKAFKKCEIIPWISIPIKKNSDEKKYVSLLKKKKPIILIVGFLNHYKFTDVIYNFLSKTFMNECDAANAEYVFCGSGPLLEEGRKRFEKNNSVSFLGWTEQSDVGFLMSKATIVLIPMSGFVLLEAASQAKAVITSDVEWHSELVKHGINGCVVNPKDENEWLLAINQLLANKKTRDLMGDRLKLKYLKEYSPEKCAAFEMNLYEKLIN